jgi:cytochrome c5
MRLTARTFVFAFLAALFCAVVTSLVLADSSGKEPAKKDEATTTVVPAVDAENMRIEGEKRFHANCGRCHAAPQKFPPRMMKTVLRHMRVRATITDADMRLVLFYMTQ